ncbi:sulfite exporter TauE/SafE family protein [Rhodobacteraceae bacterium CCMM004]|nr:sulfite exporter TauE/SafE family protein [Rhodobacteraceae bacterium CCMM004]
MELSAGFFALAVPAVIFAGVSKGGFGSGAAFAAAPFLALILEPGQAIGVMLPLLMLMDVAALKPYWRQWNRAIARRLILAGLPGVALGAALYGLADADVMRLLIGGVALGFVAFRLSIEVGWLRPERLHMAPAWGWFWGALAGFTSFISHAGGPPAAVYMLSQRMTKAEYQATTVILFWAVNLMKAVPYAALGMFTPATLTAGLWLAPVALFGIWLGVKLHRMVSERTFFRLTYLFLVLTGAKLIWDALT